MNSLPKVAIVILNWNGQYYLEKFLPSVLATAYDNMEVIVADNGSTDESVSFLQQHFSRVKLIRLSENNGFAKGYNMALKKIQADYYAIINSDIEVQQGWLTPIINLLEQDKLNAACQPKLLSYKDKKTFEYAGGAGGWLDSFGYPFARGRVFDICEEDKGQYDTTERVFWVTGAAMVIRNNVFHEMKGFDEYFFAHQEEIDLCWRIQLAGYKLYCCPSSVVYHVGGGTLPRGNSLKTFLNFRNNQIMLYKNLPWSQKWWKVPFRIFLDAVSALKGLFIGDGGYFLSILRAHFSFLKWILFRKRQSVFPEKKVAKPAGLYKGNIVWEHFVKGKKYFSQFIK
ncbi:MAG TPA: glycosyltransferase family 2 protein [Chitinophagaceae bacterium]|nr:glycosyltransferase family 2 protein [Chitinophagaceae bacterium]